jgi:hypothetical protein
MRISLTSLAFTLVLTVLMLVLRTVVRCDPAAVALIMLLAESPVASQGAGAIVTAAALGLISTTCLIRFGWWRSSGTSCNGARQARTIP